MVQHSHLHLPTEFRGNTSIRILTCQIEGPRLQPSIYASVNGSSCISSLVRLVIRTSSGNFREELGPFPYTLAIHLISIIS